MATNSIDYGASLLAGGSLLAPSQLNLTQNTTSLLGGTLLGGLLNQESHSDRRDRRRQENIDTINNAFQEVLGRPPTQAEMDNYLNGIGNETFNSPADVKNDIRRNNSNSNSDGGEFDWSLRYGSEGEEGGGGLGSSYSGLPQQATDAFGQAQGDLDSIRTRIDAIRGGQITPESEGTVLSEAGIQALLANRQNELQSTMKLSDEALYGDLSKRGLLGSGTSGPAINKIVDQRQQMYVDPFTQFGNTIRAQVEQQRAERNAQLQQEATALRQFAAGTSAGLGQTFGNFDMQGKQLDLSNRQLGLQEELGFAGLDEQSRQFNEQMLFNQFQADRNYDLQQEQLDSQGNDYSGIGGLIGSIGGYLIPGGGPATSAIGGQLGSQLGGSLGGSSGGGRSVIDFSQILSPANTSQLSSDPTRSRVQSSPLRGNLVGTLVNNSSTSGSSSGYRGGGGLGGMTTLV